MKITFKSYEDLKALTTQTDSVKEPSIWDGLINFPEHLDEDFDWFLHQIADKEFEVENYEISGGGRIEEMFTIQTSNIGTDGGENTNSVKGFFKFTKPWIDTTKTDYDGKKYWACVNCGFTVQPTVERYPFDIKKKYADIGVDNCTCPLCFTKTFKEVN